VSVVSRDARVVIVGAGPVGMVCALALNRRGVPVTVFEQEPAPVTDQRAASLHPTTLEMLDDLGVFEKILPRGLVSTAYRFHDRTGQSVVAEFDLGLLRDEFRCPFVLQYEQYKLTASIAAEYANAGDFDVRFSHAVTGLTQAADSVTVDVDTPAGPERIEAAYVIGCDGGRSTVRRLADIAFEGFTYPERFIKIATSFDFGTVNQNLVYRNFFSDPTEWCNLFKVHGERPPGLWRAIFPIGPDESDETALSPERVEARLQKFFAKPGRYHVEYVNVYGVNQRVAETFRKGRVLLAGDSAHANNPIGGLGMNGGIHDGINLADKLAQVLHGEADDELLDVYSRQRRHAADKFVQAQTIANKRFMEEREPAVRQANFDELRRTAENRETARAYMRRAALLDSLREAAAVA
jgi:3-(3-hydroxy-phenyl)propionate hydroxylase